jgi:hypothetical protein
MSASYIGSRVVDYSDDWPPFWSALVLTSGVLAALSWAFLHFKHILWTFVGIAFLIGPITTNLVTVNTAQAGTNPLSGPGSKLEGSLSKKFLAAQAGQDSRTLQIAFGSPPDAQLLDVLKTAAEEQRWAAVTITAQNAALYQLESRRPVAALGGWLGLDPVPTLEQFQGLVADGHMGFYVDEPLLLDEQKVGKETAAIIHWIRGNFIPSRIGSEVVYHLEPKRT